MENRFGEVYNFLAYNLYPPSFSKGEKQTLRRYASKFITKDGELYYVCGDKERLAVRTKELAQELFKEFHISSKDVHNGIFKTRNSLSSTFYWPGLSVDVEDWISTCEICQKFGKPFFRVKPQQQNSQDAKGEQSKPVETVKLTRKRIKEDPVKHAEYLRQERERYVKRKEQGKIKRIRERTTREQHWQRTKWRAYQAKHRKAHKGHPSWSENTAAQPTTSTESPAETDKMIENENLLNEGTMLLGEPQQGFIKITATWDWLGIDIIGPLPETKNGHTYILTVIDYFSKWVDAFPMKTNCAKEVAEKLCAVICQYGCPMRILTNQGTEFVNEVNYNLCCLFFIKHSVLVAYYPLTNELDKTTFCTMKSALLNLVKERQEDWDINLPPTLFHLRYEKHVNTKCSPFRLLYGRVARLPSEVPAELPPELAYFPEKSQENSNLDDVGKVIVMQCDRCSRWEHVDNQPETEGDLENLEGEYICLKCKVHEETNCLVQPPP